MNAARGWPVKLLSVAVMLPLAAALADVPARSAIGPRSVIRSKDSPRKATASGRVKRVDRRRAEVVVESEGRDELYGVEDARILDALREGDRVHFEYEQREGGRKVIVQVF